MRGCITVRARGIVCESNYPKASFSSVFAGEFCNVRSNTVTVEASDCGRLPRDGEDLNLLL